MKSVKTKYNKLLGNIGQTIEIARRNAVKAINTELIKANWEIGRHIIEFEQHGNERAEYGSSLLSRLSRDLKLRYGKGFGRRNILDMRRFYLSYPKWQTVSAKLSWSHFAMLLSVSDETARKFYEKQSIHESWSKREPVMHTDIGQMNMYLNYFKIEESVESDNEPIGIILSTDKDDVLVEYATGGISNKIFVSKYQLYLPNKKQLEKQVKSIMENKKRSV